MIAFVDESGHSADTDAASDHFVVSAVVVRDSNAHRIMPAIGLLREELGRPGRSISWKDIRSHSQRLHAAQSINQISWLRTISVVICKRELERNEMTAEARYQWTLRLLLERLSWMGARKQESVHTVVSHLRGFESENLARYERILQSLNTEIKWRWLDPGGCEVVNAADREELQFADLVASATGQAFERDDFGNVESRYLREMRAPIWDNEGGSILTYGLKIHPNSVLSDPRYSWLTDMAGN
jgi:hypothetical protein